jgi:protoporphyrinogen/coproporphyrinogen III oxidase
MRVVVVGSGIAGLGAAWELQRAGAEVVIVEQDPFVGGRCRSTNFGGRDVALGAFAFLEKEVALIRLAEQLGLRQPGEVIDLTSGHMLRVLAANGKTTDVSSITPAAMMTLPFVPAREKVALGRLGVLTARMMIGKRYAAPEDAAALDEVSVTEWCRRHAPTLYDKFLEPTMAMFCGFADHEVSLAFMLWANGKPTMSSKPLQWWTLAGGVGRLTETLAQRLVERGASIRLDVAVRAVTPSDSRVTVTTTDGELAADAVVVAVPGPSVPAMMPELSADRRQFFESVRYSAHDLAYYVTDDLGTPPGGSLGDAGIGMLLPTSEGFELASNTHWTSIGSSRSLVLIQSKGRHLGPLADAPDDVILDALWNELGRVTRAARSVVVHDRLLARWDAAIPVRPVGSLRALHHFRSLGPMPRVAFAGDYLRNSSVGQALVTGQQAAAELLRAKI